MNGDISRQTFNPAKGYTAVVMQQGRVQLDADWNEQAEITRHRAETETLDTVGRCGGPLHDAAFGLVKPAGLSRAEQDYVKARWKALGKGDFLLSPGRYYVDGILVESEHAVPFAQQPDLPGARPLPGDNGDYLLYLDVWERHLTALEEPSVPALEDRAVPLREIALGGQIAANVNAQYLFGAPVANANVAWQYTDWLTAGTDDESVPPGTGAVVPATTFGEPLRFHVTPLPIRLRWGRAGGCRRCCPPCRGSSPARPCRAWRTSAARRARPHRGSGARHWPATRQPRRHHWQRAAHQERRDE